MQNLQQRVVNDMKYLSAHMGLTGKKGFIQKMTFSARMHNLSDEERADYQAVEQGRLSEDIRKALEACDNEAQRDELISAYARTQLFRLQAWQNYLNGVSNNKPFTSSI